LLDRLPSAALFAAGTFAATLLLATVAARGAPRRLELGQQITLLLLIPGLVLALEPAMLPSFPGRHLWTLILGPLPLGLLPLLRTLRRAPAGQARAAAGLGASPAARLRRLWLPQLGPALLGALLLILVLDLAALSLRPS